MGEWENEKVGKEEESGLVDRELVVVRESVGKINEEMERDVCWEREMKMVVNEICGGREVQTEE
ncbi:hypothetical protein, partial [Cytobacillus oceanisediminis]|uniref:hypothetical protein n=1 Tax=Cytobacillus oceanisediminis TaxID=665099 RepID=UPI00119E80FD